MKWLLDECLSPRLAEALGIAGHDAVHVRGTQSFPPGAPDAAVATLAHALDRVLLTLDKAHFGRWLLENRATEHPRVVLLRELLTPVRQLAALWRWTPEIEQRLARDIFVIAVTAGRPPRPADLPSPSTN